MPARSIGEIIRRMFGPMAVRSGALGFYEWTFEGYDRCGGCEASVEWWRASNGSKVALDPDPTTFRTEGDLIRLARHEMDALVERRTHRTRCPNARFWRHRKRGAAKPKGEALRRIGRRRREARADEDAAPL